MAYDNPRTAGRIAGLVEYMRLTNRRNGIGRPPLYKRYRIYGAAA